VYRTFSPGEDERTVPVMDDSYVPGAQLASLELSVKNRSVLRSLARFAPASAAFAVFLTGAATAAGIVPIILSTWPDWLQVVFIVVSGLLWTPVGGLLGIVLRDRMIARTDPKSE
jgi:hypothetical protein